VVLSVKKRLRKKACIRQGEPYFPQAKKPQPAFPYKYYRWINLSSRVFSCCQTQTPLEIHPEPGALFLTGQAEQQKRGLNENHPVDT